LATFYISIFITVQAEGKPEPIHDEGDIASCASGECRAKKKIELVEGACCARYQQYI